MEQFADIKNLWVQAQPKHTGNAAEILTAAQKHRRNTTLSLLLAILSLVATLGVLAAVCFLFHFQYATTRLGIALAALAVLGGIVLNTQMAWLMLNPNNRTDNKTFLATMQKIKSKEEYIYRRGLSVYFILLVTGMMLYLYEFTFAGPLFSIIAYGTTLAWFLFVWCYLRPKAIAKRRKKTTTIIEHYKRIAEQME